MKYITTINNREYIIEIADDTPHITVNGEAYAFDFQSLGEGGLVSMLLNNRSFEGAVGETAEGWQVLLGGELYEAVVQDERAYRLAKARGQLQADTGEVQMKAPMPGVVIKVVVAVGDVVTQGQTLVILESMKMENELKATRDAVVLDIRAQAGHSVEKNQVLVVIGDAAG
ncbi:MAG: biotin/lipoyl-binding protein [Chloroflexi bacterium]|nr:biotin/lipoyl-binding protein [Chloroflexota bacterium]